MIRNLYDNHPLRRQLIESALAWERSFGVMPGITSQVSEFDVAMLVGHTPETYAAEMQGTSAVRKGFDFCYGNKRYQVKANRPSGKPGSGVTLVGKANNYEWDILVWILYNQYFEIQECWQWNATVYREQFDLKSRLRPKDMRLGVRLV